MGKFIHMKVPLHSALVPLYYEFLYYVTLLAVSAV